MKSLPAHEENEWSERVLQTLGNRCLVFVGLMGAGKSVIGKLTAAAVGLPFVDSDREIETVSRMPIADLFASYGEDEFRALESRVIARLLKDGPMVLSTGGGAFINEVTRAEIRRHGLSVWLNAELDVLWERVRKRSHRPLLQTENPKQTLHELMKRRYPIYAEADISIRSRDIPKEVIVQEVLEAVAAFDERQAHSHMESNDDDNKNR